MKKLNPWLFLSLFVAAFTLSACGDDKDDNPPKDEKIEVTEANLKGTWDGSVEHDFAQGYYQRWRVQFDGKNYTAWHTHQIVGTINDQDMSLKTVGNKEQGTWEYKDDALILTPKKMWASYYLTAKTINDPYYTVYLDYNPETMECTEWYETSEYIIQQGIERDLEDGINGNEMTISVWSVVGFTKTDLSVRINKDIFKLNKQ
jgi:hypothetical protein